MKAKWFIYSLVITLCAVGVLAGLLLARTNVGLAADSEEVDLEAACALLDDATTRSLMSAMFETKLLILCGRMDELSSGLELEGSPSAPPRSIEAWADTLVNNPPGDLGMSTTQSETSIRVNPTTGTICSAYNDSQHWAQGGIAFSGFSRSTDGGLTFADRGPFPAGGGGNSFGDPSLIWRDADGYFYYATLHTNGLGIWRSTDDCENFSYLSMIHVGGGDDKEIMEVDNYPASPYYGRIYVAWTDFNAGGRIYSTFSNDGVVWSPPVVLSGVGLSVQGAWPTVAPNGDVYVAWVRWNPYPTGPIDIEVVRSTDGGVSFFPVTNPMTGGVNPRDNTATINCNRPALQANVGDGIRYLPSPQIAAGPDGCLHVVYVRDPDGNGTGDVINAYYHRSCDNGVTWGPEVLLNDDGTLTDQYFPTVSVGPGNIVVSTWYDRRNDPGNYLIDYYKAYSYDGGVTWGPNIRVSDVSTPIPQLNPNFDPIVATCYYGDYDQQVQFDNAVYILWSDSRNVQNGHPDPDIWFEKEQVGAFADILVVDDDDNAPDVRAYYTDALDALGLTYDIWDTANSDNEPDLAYLENYQAVVWFTGDEYGGFAGPDSDGESALATWLDGAASIVGDWTLNYDWLCDGSFGATVAHFFPDGTFTTDDGGSGTWTQNGDQVEWVFPSGTTYTGTISGDYMEGTMVSFDGTPGCWNANRIVAAGTVTVVSGERTSSGEPAEEPGVAREVYVSPQASLVPVGSPLTPEGASSDAATAQPYEARITSQSILHIATNTTEQSIQRALNELGLTYDYYYGDDWTGINFTPYDVVIVGMDGGGITSASIQKVRNDVIDQGKRLIFIGGTCWEDFATGVNQYLVLNDITDYCWTVSSSPHWTIVDPGHGLASGLPPTYDFIDLSAAYYQTRSTDPNLEVVAVNGDGFDDFFYKGGSFPVLNNSPSQATGDLIWFINSPYDGYWSDQADFDVLKQIVDNAISYGRNRCLLISAQDYLYDRGLTPFMQNYLGVASYVSDVGQTSVAGAGSVYSGLGPYSLVYPGGNFSDQLEPDVTAEVAFTGDAGNAALDKFGATYFTSFLGYPYDAIPNLPDRADVMATFLASCNEPPQDFPDIDVSPPSMFSQQLPDTQVVQPLDISNLGTAALNWSIDEAYPLLSIPPARGDHLVGEHPPSAGAPPVENTNPIQTPTGAANPLAELLGSLAYATETQFGFYTAFDLDIPEILPSIAPYVTYIWAGDFVGNDFSKTYNIRDDNTLVTIDTATGVETVIGAIPPPPNPGEIYTGMAYDPTTGNMYASTTDLASSWLYLVDLVTPSTSLIGLITNSPGMIAIAADDSGQLWGHDLMIDSLISINKNTAAGTVIGELGFDANFGQGMDFDSATGQLYLSAFNNGTFQAELRIADTGTGNTVLVGVLGAVDPGGLTQLGWMAVAAGGGGGGCFTPLDVPWLSVSPDTGTTLPGDTTTVDVTFDSTGLPPGFYETALLCINSNDPDESLVEVPVTLEVVQPTVVLSFEPPVADLIVSDTLDVDLYVQDVQNLYGVQLEVQFDPSLVEVVDADPGTPGVQITPGTCPQPDFVVVNDVDNVTGVIQYAATSLAPTPPCNGSGAMATVTFHGLAGGDSWQVYTSYLLSDPDGIPIPVLSTLAGLIHVFENPIDGFVVLQSRVDHSGAEVCAWQGGVPVACTFTDASGYYILYVGSGLFDVEVEMGRYLDGLKTGVSGGTTLTTVTLLGGDTQDDEVINILDLSFIGARFFSTCGDPLYDERADINNDCTINILDITVTAANFNKTSPVPWP